MKRAWLVVAYALLGLLVAGLLWVALPPGPVVLCARTPPLGVAVSAMPTAECAP